MKTHANSAMKPILLKPHLGTNHSEKANPDESYFQRLAEKAKQQRLDEIGAIYQRKMNVVEALYEVAVLVAQNQKADTIEESPIMPAARILVNRCFVPSRIWLA